MRWLPSQPAGCHAQGGRACHTGEARPPRSERGSHAWGGDSLGLCLEASCTAMAFLEESQAEAVSLNKNSIERSDNPRPMASRSLET